MCTQENIFRNINAFKEQLALTLKNDLIRDIQADSFERLFYKIKSFIPKNFIFVFDDFSYLINQDKSIVSQFQKIYDEYFKEIQVKLILNGSSNSTMGDLLSYQSPLYGRRTATINLQVLSFHEVRSFLKNLDSLKEVVKYNLIFGGVPYYLEQIDQNLSFEENFKKFFFKGQSMFLDEVLFLLKEEFREVRNYLAIIESIAKGKTRFNEISDVTNIDKGALSTYLKNLEVIGIINNVKSFFDKQNSKKTVYRIVDNYIYFYYFVIYSNLNNLNNKLVQKNIINLVLPQSFGYLFEIFSENILKSNFEKIGVYFKDGIEIDLLGKFENKISCFECKFVEKIDLNKILTKLDEKIDTLPKEFIYEKHIISINDDYTLKKLLKLSNF